MQFKVKGAHGFGGVFAGFAMLALAGASHGATPLRIGMVPDAGATIVSVEEKAPLQKYLEKALGHPVKLIIPTNYNATVEGLGNGSIDIAYLGGLTYVKAHARYGAIPLVQRDVDRKFQSLFITREGSGIASLKDLQGKSFCFGDINSTSGHLYPFLTMKQSGIVPERTLKSFRYTGSHPATAQAVAAGACDAGAIDETVFKSLLADGKITGAKLKVFYTTPPFADYIWAARKDLSQGDQQAFEKALLDLQIGRDGHILEILRGAHFVRADNAEYDKVEQVAKELGLM